MVITPCSGCTSKWKKLSLCGVHRTTKTLAMRPMKTSLAANLICLVYDYYNNGSLNIEVRLSRYNEECKHGAQFCQEWFEQVKYWYEMIACPRMKNKNGTLLTG